MAPHSSTLAWKIPKDRWAWWAAVHGVAKSWTQLSKFTFTFHFHALEKEMATHSSVPAWRSPGTGEPGGPPSMGSHRVGHDWSDLAAAAADPVITLTQCWCCRSRGTAPEPSSGWQGWGLDPHWNCAQEDIYRWLFDSQHNNSHWDSSQRVRNIFYSLPLPFISSLLSVNNSSSWPNLNLVTFLYSSSKGK